jgi:hypothetical protein
MRKREVLLPATAGALAAVTLWDVLRPRHPVTSRPLRGSRGLTAPLYGVDPRVSAGPQSTLTWLLQTNAVANGNGLAANTDGFNGALQFLVSNGAGSCTLTFQGSWDNFATAQDVQTLGVFLLASATGGTSTVNTGRAVTAGAVSVAANTSYVYAVSDLYLYTRAVISAQAGLGAGTNVTGCTVKLYGVPQ